MSTRLGILSGVFGCMYVLAPSPSPGAEPSPSLRLHDLFSEHALLQRDRPIAVWGDASPESEVTVGLGGNSATATAGASGRWEATLPAMGPGGPYELEVRAGEASQTVHDILIGDVWLCSGQSNMALPVSRSLNAQAEIRRATQDTIRHTRIAESSSATPLDRFQTAPPLWQPASPETAGDFSATCYYFARELQKHVDVPMGLINASWGGSRIEPWISEGGLRTVGGFGERLDLLRLHEKDPHAGVQRMGELWEAWWQETSSERSEPWHPQLDDAPAWADVPVPMRDWTQWGVAEFERHHGMVWFRRVVHLNGEQAAQAATLSLGGIDEVDQTWLNSEPIGNTFGYGTERVYQLRPGVLREGQNVVVVNVLNTWAAGGMVGPDEELFLRLDDGTTLPLAGEWRYQIVPASHSHPPRAPWESVAGLTGLHGAMIAPLRGYGLRGAVWYQGESNGGDPESYEGLLAGLMADWRGAFGAELPFLVVQLPDYGAPPTSPVDSGWARLRDAQRRVVAADPRAGLVVTIDVGDRSDIHPANKQAVGSRLARAARQVVYGEEITPSGPTPLGARRQGEHVAVRFASVEGALLTYSADHAWGFELCGADQASCRFAAGVVQDRQVLLDPAVAPEATRVRFCWGDGPVCNLYDESGLPAGPFEVRIE